MACLQSAKRADYITSGYLWFIHDVHVHQVKCMTIVCTATSSFTDISDTAACARRHREGRYRYTQFCQAVLSPEQGDLSPCHYINGFTTAFAALHLITLARWRPPIATIRTQTDSHVGNNDSWAFTDSQ